MVSSRNVSSKEWNNTDVFAIKALVEAGLSRGKIASQLAIPESTIGPISRKLTHDPDLGFLQTKRTGRPRKLNTTSKRRMIRYVRRNPRSTINELTSPLKFGHTVHKSTIQRVLQRNDFGSFLPRMKLFLNAVYTERRLEWALQMKKLKVGEIDNLRPIIFTDESTFEVREDFSAPGVLRKKGEAYLLEHLTPSLKSGGTSISVWGAISYDYKGPLIFLPNGERLTSTAYVEKILNQEGHRFYEEVTSKHGITIWQQDSTTCYTAKTAI